MNKYILINASAQTSKNVLIGKFKNEELVALVKYISIIEGKWVFDNKTRDWGSF